MGFFRKLEDEIKDVGRKIDKELIRPVAKTVEAVVTDPKKLALVAAAIYLGPAVSTKLGSITGLSGTKLAVATGATLSGGTAALSGASGKEILQSVLLGGLTAGASAGYADTIGQSFGLEAGSIASKAAGNAVIAGAKTGVTGGNVLESMVISSISSALANKGGFDATEFEGSLAKPGVDDYQMTTDFGTGVDYSMGSNLTFPKTSGIDLDDGSGLGFQQPSSRNLNMMGGGQGLTATKTSGAVLAGTDPVGVTSKDLKRGFKVAGSLIAADAVKQQVSTTTSSNKMTMPSATDPNKNIYEGAPLEGFGVYKFTDSNTGKIKYIPFVNEESLLPVPTGSNWVKSRYAKGGFVSKKETRTSTRSKGLASRRA
jgi:hypothetical protein